jgi:hypothetical protein
MRGRKEHVNMLFGDVKMMNTAISEQYLEYNERQKIDSVQRPGKKNM